MLVPQKRRYVVKRRILTAETSWLRRLLRVIRTDKISNEKIIKYYISFSPQLFISCFVQPLYVYIPS